MNASQVTFGTDNENEHSVSVPRMTLKLNEQRKIAYPTSHCFSSTHTNMHSHFTNPNTAYQNVNVTFIHQPYLNPHFLLTSKYEWTHSPSSWHTNDVLKRVDLHSLQECSFVPPRRLHFRRIIWAYVAGCGATFVAWNAKNVKLENKWFSEVRLYMRGPSKTELKWNHTPLGDLFCLK